MAFRFRDVVDLNLLDAYFEALGIEQISELVAGTGNPPEHDPQIFAGYLQLVGAQDGYNHAGPSLFPQQASVSSALVLHSIFPTSFNSLSPLRLSFTMTNNQSTAFERLERDSTTSFIISGMQDGLQVEYTIHALQVRAYFAHDLRLRKGEPFTTEPMGYYEFAHLFNQESKKPHRLTTYDADSMCWVPNGPPVTPQLLPIDFYDPNHPIRHVDLQSIGVVTSAGIVNPDGVRVVRAALEYPMRQRLREQKQAERRLEEKANKKRKASELSVADIDYTLPIVPRTEGFRPVRATSVAAPSAPMDIEATASASVPDAAAASSSAAAAATSN